MFHKFAALAFAFLLAGCGDGFAPEQQAEQNPPEKGPRCQSASPVSAHQALFASYANPLIVADSADFDGTNDSMALASGPSGIADGKTGTISVWVRIDGGTTGAIVFAGASALAPRLYLNWTTSAFNVVGKSAADGFVLLMTSSASYASGATWYHVLGSWDLANAYAEMYVNDVSDDGSPTIVNTDIEYTTDWYVGAVAGPAVHLDGCLAELYFSTTSMNLSLVHNRRKFISASGKPVHLGTTGALPTGTAPLVYLHLADGEAVANFATNRGTGGDFTITGTLATGSTSPSD